MLIHTCEYGYMVEPLMSVMQTVYPDATFRRESIFELHVSGHVAEVTVVRMARIAKAVCEAIDCGYVEGEGNGYWSTHTPT